MMSEYVIQIEELLDIIFSYGPFWVYLAIGAACFIENITPPFPGDSFIVVAGGLVAAGRLEPTLALISIMVGGMASVMVVYAFGRRYGRSYFIRKNYRFLSAADILEVEEKFDRRGGLLLVASRFVVGFRVILALAAGISRYSVTRMVVYTAISYLMFAGLLMYLGYKLIENASRIEYYFRTYNYVAWPLVIVVVLVLVARRIHKARRAGTK